MSEYVLDRPTHFTCPECAGALAKIDSEPVTRYVCHIGHSLTHEAMLQAQAERIETFSASALALLNERRELCRQMLEDGADDRSRIDTILRDATKGAEMLRDFLNDRRALQNL